MKDYEKPLILSNEELNEGVYAASGDSATGCKSIYMNGTFRANTRHLNVTDWANDSDSKHTLMERGCEGCPYNWGSCAVNNANAQSGQDARPGWERAGYSATDTYNSWGS